MSLARDLEIVGLPALPDRAALRARYVAMVEIHAPERDPEAWLLLARAYGRLDARLVTGGRPEPRARIDRDPDVRRLDAVLSQPDLADDLAAHFERVARDPAAAPADEVEALIRNAPAWSIFALARHALGAGHGHFAADIAARALRADHGDRPSVTPTEPTSLLLRIAAHDEVLDHEDLLAALLEWIGVHGPAYDLLATHEVALLSVARELIADPCDMPHPLRRSMARALLAGEIMLAGPDLAVWAYANGFRAQSLAWRLRRHGSGTATYAEHMLGRPNGVGPLSVWVLQVIAFAVGIGAGLAIASLLTTDPDHVLYGGLIGLGLSVVAGLAAHRWSARIWRWIYRRGTDRA